MAASSSNTLLAMQSTSSSSLPRSEMAIPSKKPFIGPLLPGTERKAHYSALTSSSSSSARVSTRAESKFQSQTPITVDQLLPYLFRAVHDRSHIAECLNLMSDGIQYQEFNDIKHLCGIAKTLPPILKEMLILNVVTWISAPDFASNLIKQFPEGRPTEVNEVLAQVYEICSQSDHFKNDTNVMEKLQVILGASMAIGTPSVSYPSTTVVASSVSSTSTASLDLKSQLEKITVESKHATTLTVNDILPHLARALLDSNYIGVCLELMNSGIRFNEFKDIGVMCKMAEALPQLRDKIMLNVVLWMDSPGFFADLIKQYPKGRASNEIIIAWMSAPDFSSDYSQGVPEGQAADEVADVLVRVFRLCVVPVNSIKYLEVLVKFFNHSYRDFERFIPKVINEIAQQNFPKMPDWEKANPDDKKYVKLCFDLMCLYIINCRGHIQPHLFEFLIRLNQSTYIPKSNINLDHISDRLRDISLQESRHLTYGRHQLAEIFLQKISNYGFQTRTLADAIKYADYFAHCFIRFKESGLDTLLKESAHTCLDEIIQLLVRENSGDRLVLNAKAIEYAAIVLCEFLNLFPAKEQKLDLKRGEGIQALIYVVNYKKSRELQGDGRLWVLLAETAFVTDFGRAALSRIGLLLKEKIMQRVMEVFSEQPLLESKEVAQSEEENLFLAERNKRLEVSPEKLKNFILNLPNVVNLWDVQDKLIVFAQLLKWQNKLEYAAVSTLALLRWLGGTQELIGQPTIGENVRLKIVEKMDSIIKLILDLLRSENIDEFRMGCELAQYLDIIFEKENFLNSARIIAEVLERGIPRSPEIAKTLPLIVGMLSENEAEIIFRAGLELLQNKEPIAVPTFCREFIRNVSPDARYGLIDIVLPTMADPVVICQLAQFMNLPRLIIARDKLLSLRAFEHLANFFIQIPASYQKELLASFLTKERTAQALRAVSDCLGEIARNNSAGLRQALAEVFTPIANHPAALFTPPVVELPTSVIDIVVSYCEPRKKTAR